MNDLSSASHRHLSTILANPDHPHHSAAKAEMDRRKMKNEGAMKRMVTTQSNKADRMASTDKKGLETYKKKKIDEISLDMLTKKISNTGMKSTDKAMNKDKVKNDLKALRARLDKAKPVAEKTLTPAEKKKREEIAQAMHRDNPDMPMGKKMAIATATAKKVTEGAYLKGSIESRADAHEDQADHHNAQAEKAHKAGDKMAASTHKAAARAHMKAASYFDKHLSKPKHLRPQAAGGATSQAAHAATQKANQYNESVTNEERRHVRYVC